MNRTRTALALIGMVLLCQSAWSAESAEARIARLEKLVMQQSEMIKDLSTKLKAVEDQTAQAMPATSGNTEAGAADAGAKAMDQLSEQLGGLKITVGATGVVQGTINGDDAGLLHDIDRDGVNDDHHDKADATMSYDLAIDAPIGEHGLAHAAIEAGNGNGIDGELTNRSTLNDDADNNVNLRLTEIHYEHRWDNDLLVTRIGKLDPTAIFDGNAYANDSTSQFLSGSLVNSHNIDWTDDNAPGIDAVWDPIPWVTLSLGIYDGDGNWEAIGRDLFTIAEVGFHTEFFGRPGNYRFYGWVNNDNQLKDWIDRGNDTGYGMGLSFDQEICDWFGAFVRYSYADEDLYQLAHTWSAGVAVFGSTWGRKSDTLGFAVGQSIMSDDYEKTLAAAFEKSRETHFEMYYRYEINEHLAVSPDLQVIWDANADDRNHTVTAAGLRAQLDF